MHKCRRHGLLDRILHETDRPEVCQSTQDKQNNAEIAFLKDEDEAAIELTHWRDKKELKEGDNFDHIAFAVNDMEATMRELKRSGVTVAMEPYSLQGSTSKIAFIKDPDGNWLELIQSAKR